VGAGLGRNGGRPGARYDQLPAFCRVTATLTPTPTSDIRAELWLPMSGWNGRFIGTTTNAMGGAVPWGTMANALAEGFAVMGEDGGHRGDEANWMDDQDRRIDFGHRAIHEATVFGKALTNAFYGEAPAYAYMRECGGATTAALAAPQTYPNDYDGVIAGAFPAYWTRQIFGQMWPWYATHKDEASYVPPAKYPAIHDAVLKACDALDGVRDGVLEDPTRCTWDPREMLCRGGDGPSCLTAPQVEAVRKIYEGPINPRTKEKIHSPLFRGSELGWEVLAGPQAAGGVFPTVPFFRSFVFKDPTWDYAKRPLDFDNDVTRANTPDLVVVNATKPDLSPFVGRGGRIILVNGWSNAIVPPGYTIDYYNTVRHTIGPRATDSGVRLYMVPDMGECSGGAGTDTFDMFAALRNWVENGQAPQAVIASRVDESGRVSRTRPLCPYPQVAVYKGNGSTDDAANFSCQVPQR
jgi:feruloyl esterase